MLPIMESKYFKVLKQLLVNPICYAVILGKDNVEIDKKIAEKNAEIEKIKIRC